MVFLRRKRRGRRGGGGGGAHPSNPPHILLQEPRIFRDKKEREEEEEEEEEIDWFYKMRTERITRHRLRCCFSPANSTISTVTAALEYVTKQYLYAKKNDIAKNRA
jgi:hypothetical protein